MSLSNFQAMHQLRASLGQMTSIIHILIGKVIFFCVCVENQQIPFFGCVLVAAPKFDVLILAHNQT